MSFLEQILLTHRLWPGQIVRLEADLYLMLAAIAVARGKTVPALVAETLYALACDDRAQAETDYIWDTLTQREQQVTALACLGYTNREIADRLVISVNTVRSHIRNILEKYRVSSKAELRLTMSGWDFHLWLESQA